MRPPGALRKQAGFTLIELLVTLALMSIIVAAVAGGLHLGRRAWELDRRDQSGADLEAATRALAAILSRALPIAAPRDNAGPALVFEGGPQGLLFVSLSEGRTEFGGPIRVVLGLKKIGGLTDLALSTAVYRASSAWVSPDGARATLVARSVTKFALAYFGATSPEGKPAWRKDWMNFGRLPRLIRMDLRVGGRWRSHEAALSIRLRQF